VSLGFWNSNGRISEMEKINKTQLARKSAVQSRWYGNRRRTFFLVFALTLMVVDMYLIFVWAPTESVMGHVQRIFYIHVPMAWTAFLAFFLVFLASILYLPVRKAPAWTRKWLLWERNSIWDIVASSAAEIGLVFTTLVLITGPIWAKPIWGIWWTWDARLTTTLVLWLIYVAYLMLRAYSSNRAQAGVYSAVLGIIGFIDVIIVYRAVDWWETQHQRLVVSFDRFDVASDMRLVLYFSTFTFLVLFGYLMWHLISIKRLEITIRQTRDKLSMAKIRDARG